MGHSPEFFLLISFVQFIEGSDNLLGDDLIFINVNEIEFRMWSYSNVKPVVDKQIDRTVDRQAEDKL